MSDSGTKMNCTKANLLIIGNGKLSRNKGVEKKSFPTPSK
jgi:hypothetical protein